MQVAHGTTCLALICQVKLVAKANLVLRSSGKLTYHLTLQNNPLKIKEGVCRNVRKLRSYAVVRT